MPITNITPSRVTGKYFYIRSSDRHLFALGGITVRVLTPHIPAFPANVNPKGEGTEPFTVHCPDLFRISNMPLLPLRDGDVVHYEVDSEGVRITNVKKPGSSAPPRPTSKTQIPGGYRGPTSRRSTTFRQRQNQTLEETLSTSTPPKLPGYLEENKNRIISQAVQFLPPWKRSYDRYTAPVMERLREAFPDRKITRQDLIQLFASWDDPVLGLVATMVWGMISTGGRAGDHLQSLLDMEEDVLKMKMERLRTLIRDGELERAFQECSPSGPLKFNGVDYAFFTKLFCFIGHAPPALQPSPLILDSRTSSAFFVLGAQAAPELPWTVLCNAAPLHKNKSATWRARPTPIIYKVFVNWFDHWARSLDCPALQLEQFVFGISKKTRAGRSPLNPRTQLENLGQSLFPRA